MARITAAITARDAHAVLGRGVRTHEDPGADRRALPSAGRLDILVNKAGYAEYASVAEMSNAPVGNGPRTRATSRVSIPFGTGPG